MDLREEEHARAESRSLNDEIRTALRGRVHDERGGDEQATPGDAAIVPTLALEVDMNALIRGSRHRTHAARHRSS